MLYKRKPQMRFLIYEHLTCTAAYRKNKVEQREREKYIHCKMINLEGWKEMLDSLNI